MTSEKVARHFTGPTEKKTNEFWFHPKGRRYPRTSFMLFFNQFSRRFFLHKVVLPRADSRVGKRSLVNDERVTEAFRLSLPGEIIARCTAKALAAPQWPHLGGDTLRDARWP